jgi:hypothetical protein
VPKSCQLPPPYKIRKEILFFPICFFNYSPHKNTKKKKKKKNKKEGKKEESPSI